LQVAGRLIYKGNNVSTSFSEILALPNSQLDMTYWLPWYNKDLDTQLRFADINNGPVQIVSDQPIVAAERVIYKVNNVATSFSEMMALPNTQLDATYWLPWYNNVDLDTQLRFGVPLP
jgi:hypothetical protein